MDFKKISNEELSLSLEKLARTECKITHVILLRMLRPEDDAPENINLKWIM